MSILDYIKNATTYAKITTMCLCVLSTIYAHGYKCNEYFEPISSRLVLDLSDKLNQFPELAQSLQEIFYNKETSPRVKNLLKWIEQNENIVVREVEPPKEPIEDLFLEEGVNPPEHKFVAHYTSRFSRLKFSDALSSENNAEKSNGKTDLEGLTNYILKELSQRKIKNSKQKSEAYAEDKNNVSTTVYLPTNSSLFKLISYFIHEASHHRINEFLNKNIERLSPKFSSRYILERIPGREYVINEHLFDFITEKYAEINELEIMMLVFKNHNSGNIDIGNYKREIEDRILDIYPNLDLDIISPFRNRTISSTFISGQF